MRGSPAVPWRILYFALLIGSPWLAQPAIGQAACRGRAELNQYERGQFVETFEGERSEVYAQFLSEAGCGAAMLERLRQVGATIRYGDAVSGYALITIARSKLLDTLDIRGIEYAYARDDDRLYAREPAAPIPARSPAEVPPIAIPYPRVATSLAPGGPYFPLAELGLIDFWREHPDADGRGVRIAMVDDGFDLLHPALRRARDARGAPVPKIADIETLTRPQEDSSWVQMATSVHTSNGRFEAAGRMWIAPEDGDYRFGVFQQDLELGPSANARTKRLTLAVGVLWSPQRNRLWVDTDGDGSFANQRPLGDYSATHDVDWFGSQTPQLDNRIPFAVKIDAAHDSVYIRIGGEHGAYIAGSVANRLTGGLFDGAAPNAQVVDENSDRATLLAALVQAFARSDVDVVNFSGGVGRGFSDADAGMEDFAQHVLERAVAVYDKPITAYSAAPGAIDVEDFAGAEMLRRNRQVGPPYVDTTNGAVWWLDNGLINTVLSPSTNLQTQSRYVPLDLPEADGTLRGFGNRMDPTAPAGYTIGDNPSPAIAVASALLATLISGAKEDHIRYDAARLVNCLFTGARLIDGVPLSQQGYGLINAVRSWQQLLEMSRADDPANPQLTSFALSRMTKGSMHAVSGFHAELPSTQKDARGEIWVTRRGGYPGGRRYRFALRGSDGAFTLLDQRAILFRDRPARVRFRMNASPGEHVVLLELRDVTADVVMQDVPLSVRAPEPSIPVSPGTYSYVSNIAPLRSEYRYVQMGEQVQAVRYRMRIPYTGRDDISTRYFPGSHYRTSSPPRGEPEDANHHVGPTESLESLVVNDAPGIQEIFWENRGRPEYATRHDDPPPDGPIHVELTVSKYALGIRSAGNRIAITNYLAPVRGRTEFYDAGLRADGARGAGVHAMATWARTLPSGLSQWRVRVEANRPAGTDADVYVLDCTGKFGCRLAAQQELTAAGAMIAIDTPAPGAWRILVLNRESLSIPVSYSFREATLVVDPALTETTDGDHAHASTWDIALPSTGGTARYAAFRIAGAAGNWTERNGVRVAMTPLAAGLP